MSIKIIDRPELAEDICLQRGDVIYFEDPGRQNSKVLTDRVGERKREMKRGTRQVYLRLPEEITVDRDDDACRGNMHSLTARARANAR